MSWAWTYYCYTGLYLYKKCPEHKDCFTFKNNDSNFLRELKSYNLNCCNIDFFSYLGKHIK